MALRRRRRRGAGRITPTALGEAITPTGILPGVAGRTRLGQRRGMGMPGALIGREQYGQAGFQRMGAAGRRRRIG